ncbi:MAG TPA: ABC transporter substrate-binding protein [Chloroflexota bacterium]|nr:ABC transporter substrate-binding protein [Chloroflexota bacterium]
MDTLNITGYQVRPDYMAAEEQGFFTAERLEVNFERAWHAPTHNKGMAEGRWDLTLSSADTMIARTTRDGADYVIFLNGERGLDVQLVGAPGIESVYDIRGKTMAGDPGDSNYDLHRRKIMRDHGIMEDEYGVEVVGATPERFEALMAGKVVAAMLTPAHSGKAVAQGGCKILANAADYIPEYPVLSGWTRRQWAQDHRELLVRFIRAYVRGSDWVLDPVNREAAIEMIQRRDGFTRERAEANLARVIPHAAIDPPGLARVAALRAEMGLYDPPYDPVERFYDASYWCEATGLPAPEPYGVPDMQALMSPKVAR